METRIVVDSQSGETVHLVDWNFQRMAADEFKTKFKSEIQKPVQSLLKEFDRNPGNSLFPSTLKASILGLLHGLAHYYHFLLSRSDQQKNMNASQMFGLHAGRQVGIIPFQSVSEMRKTCLSIVDTANRDSRPFIFQARSLDEIEHMFSSQSFAGQMATTRRGAKPGVSFSVLVCWQLQELMPTNFPDTFLEPKIVRLIPECDLESGGPLEMSKNYLLKKALYADEVISSSPCFNSYVHETCALCNNAGVKKLQNCSRCHIAKYCGREHQVQHWSEHKKHCKRLGALREEFYG